MPASLYCRISARHCREAGSMSSSDAALNVLLFIHKVRLQAIICSLVSNSQENHYHPQTQTTSYGLVKHEWDLNNNQTGERAA